MRPLPAILSIPKIHDDRGNLSFIQNQQTIPFDIQRVYWIYDVPGDEKRGGHAFKINQELIIAISGSFEVEVHGNDFSQLYHLNRSYFGLYVPPGHWREIKNFSTNSFCLVLSSTNYDVNDYLYNYEEYLEFIRHHI